MTQAFLRRGSASHSRDKVNRNILRGDRQDLLHLGATEETGSKIERRARRVARCPVCDVGPDQHCEMCGSFENCPRVLPQKVTP
jgi:hypothetical protein